MMQHIKALKKTNSALDKMKIPFIVASVSFFVLEFIIIIFTIWFPAMFIIGIFVLGIYVFSCLLIILLYLYTFPKMILKLNKNTNEHVKKSALMLTIFISVLLFGIFVLMSMLILQFLSLIHI